MVLQPVSTVQLQQNRRRGEIERARSIEGQLYVVSYMFDMVGPGEQTRDVNFPVWFQEKPVCSFGGELGDNNVLRDGNFPWCSVMVAEWDTEDVNSTTFYRGATLVLVCGGSGGGDATLHWRAEGKALANPVG